MTESPDERDEAAPDDAEQTPEQTPEEAPDAQGGDAPVAGGSEDAPPAEQADATAEPQPSAEDTGAAPTTASGAEAAGDPTNADAAAAAAAGETAEDAGAGDDEGDDEAAAPRERPAIPGMDLEVDIVGEGEDPLALALADRIDAEDLSEAADEQLAAADDTPEDQPIAVAAIDLAADARYRATGKRKTAIARVILRPGTGVYTVNGKTLDEFFPRPTLQRTIRQPLETVGYEDRMDVVARLHGGGVSAQAGALRHGISRALLEADPNLRGELKRRGFLTRDARAKERKKAGLKKARKRPQFSKR